MRLVLYCDDGLLTPNTNQNQPTLSLACFASFQIPSVSIVRAKRYFTSTSTACPPIANYSTASYSVILAVDYCMSFYTVVI